VHSLSLKFRRSTDSFDGTVGIATFIVRPSVAGKFQVQECVCFDCPKDLFAVVIVARPPEAMQIGMGSKIGLLVSYRWHLKCPIETLSKQTSNR
jgi:hypothetical protein